MRESAEQIHIIPVHPIPRLSSHREVDVDQGSPIRKINGQCLQEVSYVYVCIREPRSLCKNTVWKNTLLMGLSGTLTEDGETYHL